MSLTLRIDGERWRGHLRSVADAHPGLVPVVKGNGYGFGRPALARRTQWIGTDTIAVGTYTEVPSVFSRYDGDVLVMSPWRPFLPEVRDGSAYDPRIIHTVGRLEDIAELARSQPGARVVIEGLTSMERHGLDRHSLSEAAKLLGRLQLEGFSLHLPMAGDNLDEAEGWIAAQQASQLDTNTVYLSHLTDSELTTLRERRPDVTIRPRIGTDLWLGDRRALRVRASVLDVHEVRRGERVGYRQRAMPRDGHLLVVSGGTAHGVGLEAPTSATSVRQRATSFAKGGLEAAGLALSPFTVAGKQRWFAEPPHMQESMLLLPSSVTPPHVGDDIAVDVRFTITTFDRVEID
ncbi:alanine racemase [Solicola gregarius]|uniref:Alanine racemase n=1 Tax=Solicola gregarius TaxID=2908642 RepID=A0AA46TLL7_9ACTN|nr:alanine racemase [Solicola gregarius]UYM07340.1 alanine racemase [Solicola gregarius]